MPTLCSKKLLLYEFSNFEQATSGDRGKIKNTTTAKCVIYIEVSKLCAYKLIVDEPRPYGKHRCCLECNCRRYAMVEQLENWAVVK